MHISEPLFNQTLSVHPVGSPRSRLVMMHELQERGVLIGDVSAFVALDAGGKGSYSARLLSVYLEPGPRWDLYDQSPYKAMKGHAVRFYQVLQQVAPAEIGENRPEVLRVRWLTDTELVEGLPYPSPNAL